jgi:hypothetical protein
VLIFVMAASAIVALLRTPDADSRWLRTPVAIYAGWLTAAAFVSLGSTAAGYGLLTNSIGWAIISVVLALVVAVTVQRMVPRAPAYAGTLIWALVGIMVGNRADPLSVTLLAGTGILALASLLLWQRRRRAVAWA